MRLSVAKQAVADEPEDAETLTPEQLELVRQIKASITARLEKYRMFPPPKKAKLPGS